eukprot:jgi/Botrbrau1/7467/Bobra.0095s0005.1
MWDGEGLREWRRGDAKCLSRWGAKDPRAPSNETGNLGTYESEGVGAHIGNVLGRHQHIAERCVACLWQGQTSLHGL